jgi:hypothetical protein
MSDFYDEEDDEGQDDWVDDSQFFMDESPPEIDDVEFNDPVEVPFVDAGMPELEAAEVNEVEFELPPEESSESLQPSPEPDFASSVSGGAPFTPAPELFDERAMDPAGDMPPSVELASNPEKFPLEHNATPVGGNSSEEIPQSSTTALDTAAAEVSSTMSEVENAVVSVLESMSGQFEEIAVNIRRLEEGKFVR